MAEPWINWDWLKVGPVLTNDKDRAEYEARRNAERQPQQGPTMEDYRRQQALMAQAATPAAVSTIPYNMNSPQAAADRATSPVTTGNLPAYPERFEDWSFGDKMRNLLDPNGGAAYHKAVGTGSNENTPAQTVMPDAPPIHPGMVPPAADENTPVDTVLPDDQTDATPAVPQDPIEAIRQQKAMVDAIYPRLPPQDIGMGDTMEQDEKQLDRSKYLAQLALFSGITQGAGGQWEGVGKGLASAGAAYSAGFDRYQKAVQNRSDRLQKRVNDKYADDTQRAGMAVDLYSANQKLEKDRMTENRKAIKDRQTDIDEYFKQRLGLAKGNDMTPQDPEKIDAILRDWRISRAHGEVVTSKDVSDK